MLNRNYFIGIYYYHSHKNMNNYEEFFDDDFVNSVLSFTTNIDNLESILKNMDKPEFIYFLQGYINSINDIKYDKLYIKYHNSSALLENFIKYIQIPFTIEENSIYINDVNVYDFLDIIYRHPMDVNNKNYNLYVNYVSKIDCYFYKTDDNAILPSHNRITDIGYDLTILKEHKRLNDVTALYDTGLQIKVPFGYYVEIVPRSSLSKSGYILANSIGIIDTSYTGNLYIALTKVSTTSPEIKFPFKCCQLILRKQYFMNPILSKVEFRDTHRNDGGFGSTG